MKRAPFWQVITDQPTSLLITLRTVREALQRLDHIPAWPANSTAGVVSMGASTCAAELLVAEARKQGRLTVNWPAAEWLGDGFPHVDLTIGISESGRSPETIDAMARASGRRVAVTNVSDSPITRVADVVVPMGDITDAGVYLSGYTSTLVTLALTSEALGLSPLDTGYNEIPQQVESWSPQVFQVVDYLLTTRFGAHPLLGVDCVGNGSSFAAASETALVIREAGRTPSAVFTTDQYLHGPAESLTTGQLLVIFGDRRVAELAPYVEQLNVPVLHIANDPVGCYGLRLPQGLGPVGRAVLEAVAGEVLAGRIGERQGHELGVFRHSFEGTKLT